MRFKIRKGMLAVKGLRLVGPTDVLVCARVLKALPQERLLAAIQQCFKYGFIEECRMLGYIDGRDYVIVVNFVDEASAGRYRENLLRNPVADLRLCETPEDAARRVKPFGQVIPTLFEAVTAMMAQDPDVKMSMLQKQAERMDRDPDGDYIFPNLSPELYRLAKDARKKPPQ
jgi:hypothetical protein